MSSPAYAPRLPADPSDFVEEASRVYALNLSADGEPKFGFRSAILWVTDDGTRYALKVGYPSQVTADGLEASLSILPYLRAHSIPVVSVTSRRDGGLCGTILGCPALLTRRIEGATHDTQNLEQVQVSGAVLGRLHCLRPDTLVLPTARPESLVRSLEGQETLRDLGVDLNRLSRCSWEDGTDCLVHGDYRAQNLLFDGNRVAAVLDWDDVAIGPNLLDLSYALLFYQSVLRSGSPQTQVMAKFLEGYGHHRPLTHAEWTLLPDYLYLALLRGLDVWCHVLLEQQDEHVHDRVSRWISGFLPLTDRVDAIVRELREI